MKKLHSILLSTTAAFLAALVLVMIAGAEGIALIESRQMTGPVLLMSLITAWWAGCVVTLFAFKYHTRTLWQAVIGYNTNPEEK